MTISDRDVVAISDGGYLTISEERGEATTRIERRAVSGGAIERRFFVDSAEHPWEPEGGRWLAETLPFFLRRTDLAAIAAG